MRAPLKAVGAGGRWPPVTANDRLKSDATRKLGVAAVGSAGVHLLVLFLAPSWTARAEQRDTLADFLRLEPLILVDEAFGSEEAASGAIEFTIEPDPLPGGTDPAGDPERSLPDLAGASDRLQGRLLGDPVTAAVLAEPEEVALAPEVEPASDEGGAELRDIGSGAAFPDWLTVPAAEFDRLSAVRPEVVVVAPTAWLLIRNPLEIDRFMHLARDRGNLDPTFEGWVQVAIWIDARGSVEWAEVSRSSGDPEVDELALDLFTEVVSFRPARNRGVPVPISVIFQLNFPFL